MSGNDWIFVQRKVHELTSAELEVYVEYHRQYLGLLQNEQESRKAEKAHGLIPSSIHLASPTTTRTTTSTETTIKKTTTTKINKKAEQAKALLQSMLAQGFSLEDILKQG